MNKEVEKIIELDKKIEEIMEKATSGFDSRSPSKLNKYDYKILEYYNDILDFLIELGRKENLTNLEELDSRYFDYRNTASMIVESYIAILQFYKNFDKEINKISIVSINKIIANFKFDSETTVGCITEIADSYFKLNKEDEAREILFDIIKEYPYEDEAYQCGQNWYMYEKPNMNKLREIIDLSISNNHVLYTDFGYDMLVEHYETMGDKQNYDNYSRLYEEWREESLKRQM